MDTPGAYLHTCMHTCIHTWVHTYTHATVYAYTDMLCIYHLYLCICIYANLHKYYVLTHMSTCLHPLIAPTSSFSLRAQKCFWTQRCLKPVFADQPSPASAGLGSSQWKMSLKALEPSWWFTENLTSTWAFWLQPTPGVNGRKREKILNGEWDEKQMWSFTGGEFSAWPPLSWTWGGLVFGSNFYLYFPAPHPTFPH